MRVGTLIPVPEDLSAEEIEIYHQQLQLALDRVKAWAEANVHRVGVDADLPIFRRTKQGGTFPRL
jgi:hypothetical protein